MESSRVEFAYKSLQKAKNFQDDPFIKFIVLWIGLNSLYGSIEVERGGEKDKILKFFDSHEEKIFNLLKENKDVLIEIDNFIEHEPQHKNIKKFLLTSRDFLNLTDQHESTRTFSLFLNRVRNNMFHAGKLWDENTEAGLLRLVNPVLESLLERLL